MARKLKTKKRRRTAFVPRIVFGLGLVGVVPMIGGCSSMSPLSVAMRINPDFGTSVAIDMVRPPDEQLVGVADIGFTVACCAFDGDVPDLTPSDLTPAPDKLPGFDVAAVFDLAPPDQMQFTVAMTGFDLSVTKDGGSRG